MPLRSRGHFHYGVEMAKRFVNVHLHCIISNMERISKISSCPPWKSFCERLCFWLDIFQITGIFLSCFGCFLPAETTKKYLNYRNFNKPFLCNIQSLETWNLRDRDRDETWNLRARDPDSQKWVSGRVSRPRPSLQTPSLPNRSNKVSICLLELLHWIFLFHCRLLTSSENLRVASTSVRSQRCFDVVI